MNDDKRLDEILLEFAERINRHPDFNWEKHTIPDAKSRLLQLIKEKEVDRLGWAWAIIANAGKIWDEDTEEAKRWREIAWKLEKEYYELQQQLKGRENA